MKLIVHCVLQFSTKVKLKNHFTIEIPIFMGMIEDYE